METIWSILSNVRDHQSKPNHTVSHPRHLNRHISAVRISSSMYVNVFLISLWHFIIYDPVVGNAAQLGMLLPSGRWVMCWLVLMCCLGFQRRKLLPPKPYVCPVLHDEFVGIMMLDQMRHPCLEVLDGMSFIASVSFGRVRQSVSVCRKSAYTVHRCSSPSP